MPETIHVPLMTPMSRRMMMAGVQLATLLVISCSSLPHSNRLVSFPTNTETAEAANNDTWLAPSSVALPKTATQHVMSAISTRNGMKLILQLTIYRSAVGRFYQGAAD
jgi:hypothetical protein